MVLYVPKEGRFVLALIPFEGAIEGDIRSNRIRGERAFLFVVTDGPVARANYEHVWVLHQPEWRPASPGLPADHWFVGGNKLSDVLSN